MRFGFSFNTTTWEEEASYFGNGYAVALSPDGTQFATASGFGWQIWDMPEYP